MFKNAYIKMGIFFLSITIMGSIVFGRGFGGFHGGSTGGFSGYRGEGAGTGEMNGTSALRGQRDGASRGGRSGRNYGRGEGLRDSGIDTYRERDYAVGNREEGVQGYRRGTTPIRNKVNPSHSLPTDTGFYALSRSIQAGDGRGTERKTPSGYGVHYISPAEYHSQALAVGNTFYMDRLFTPVWYKAHPYAWNVPGLTASAWAPATWSDIGSWCGVSGQPVFYNFGDTIIYQDNNVYMNGQPVATIGQYYDQARNLADSAGLPPAQEASSQWMPLGVFSLAQEDQTVSSSVVQLAVNKAGMIRGNYYNQISDTTLPIQGTLEKKNQRVAWIVGKNRNAIFDTGLYNLTQDEAPVLVHFGQDRPQQWLMVRLTPRTPPGERP